MTSLREFDPYSPQFGEKFSVPNLPISIKDFNGVEVSRTYSDQWGQYNGMNYSIVGSEPAQPDGLCSHNDGYVHERPGPVPGPNGTMITDPLYNPAYSQFCYEIPFMPGQTGYMDTPVVPTSAFADGYNPPDCSYPDATPAIARVTGDTNGGGRDRGLARLATRSPSMLWLRMARPACRYRTTHTRGRKLQRLPSTRNLSRGTMASDPDARVRRPATRLATPHRP